MRYLPDVIDCMLDFIPWEDDTRRDLLDLRDELVLTRDCASFASRETMHLWWEETDRIINPVFDLIRAEKYGEDLSEEDKSDLIWVKKVLAVWQSEE